MLQAWVQLCCRMLENVEWFTSGKSRRWEVTPIGRHPCTRRRCDVRGRRRCERCTRHRGCNSGWKLRFVLAEIDDCSTLSSLAFDGTASRSVGGLALAPCTPGGCCRWRVSRSSLCCRNCLALASSPSSSATSRRLLAGLWCVNHSVVFVGVSILSAFLVVLIIILIVSSHVSDRSLAIPHILSNPNLDSLIGQRHGERCRLYLGVSECPSETLIGQHTLHSGKLLCGVHIECTRINRLAELNVGPGHQNGQCQNRGRLA